MFSPFQAISGSTSASSPPTLYQALFAAGFAGLGLALLLAGCGGMGRAPSPVDSPASMQDFSRYRSFLTPGPLLPFRATGSLFFRQGDSGESGEFVMNGSREGLTRIKLFARISGSLILEILFDRERLLLLDHSEKRYHLGPNSKGNRREFLGLDITPEDFMIAVTGRLSERVFHGAGGEFSGENEATMQPGAAFYRFWLDEWGLPTRWVKEQDGRVAMRVEYKSYLEVESGGVTLRLPRKISIFTTGVKPAMVLGVRDVRPGAVDMRPRRLEPPTGEDWRPMPPRGE